MGGFDVFLIKNVDVGNFVSKLLCYIVVILSFRFQFFVYIKSRVVVLLIINMELVELGQSKILLFICY